VHEEVVVNIGEPRRVIEIEPVVVPLPERVPDPEPQPAPEPIPTPTPEPERQEPDRLPA
jgi:hypothetical protein